MNLDWAFIPSPKHGVRPSERGKELKPFAIAVICGAATTAIVAGCALGAAAVSTTPEAAPQDQLPPLPTALPTFFPLPTAPLFPVPTALPQFPAPTAPRRDAPLPTAPLPTAPLPTAPLPTAPLPTAPLPTAPLPTAPLPTAPLPTAPLPTANG